MIQETTKKDMNGKQGWLMRLATAVAEKLFAGFCTYEIGASPYETQLYMVYSGYGWEEAVMAQSLMHLKMDEEV